MSELVLKNCRLVKGLVEGYSGDFADIYIKGDRICEIRPVGYDFGEKPFLDVNRQTLLPGLIDLHMHLMFVNQDYPAMLQRTPYEYLLDCLDAAKIFLRQGYTTIRDCGCEKGSNAAVRDAVNAGRVPGPRIITSGHCVTPTERGNSCFGALYKVFDKPEDAMRVVREERELGADWIKLMATGSVMNVGGEPGALIITPDEIKALCDAAAFYGTYVGAHCHGKKAILECIKAGVKTIEHGSYLDEEVIDAILADGNRVSVIGTYAVCYALWRNLDGTVPQEFIDKLDVIMQSYGKMGIEASKAGVHFGWGSDIDQATREKYVGMEFTARADIGFDNMTMLRQATIESAKILNMDDRIGSVKEGKLADIILIDGNPDEDISVMTKLPSHVFKGGVEYTNL